MTLKELGILLKIDANSAEAQAVLRALTKQLNALPASAEKASGGITGAFSKGFADFRKDLNQAFTFSLGQMMASGIQSGLREIKQFTADSMAEFRKFEDAMTGVAKTTGIPKEELVSFSETLRDSAIKLKGLGDDAATQMANISMVAGQLGIAQDKIAAGDFKAAADELAAFAEVIAKGKVAVTEFTGGAEEVATKVAEVTNLYQKNAGEAENILSVYNGLGDSLATDANKISNFISSFTIAPQLKISFQEAAGIAATLTSIGLDANASATEYTAAISQILSGNKRTIDALTAALEASKGSQEQLAQIIGRTKTSTESFYEYFKQSLAVNAVKATNTLIDAIGELPSSVEKTEASLDIFGRTGARSMNALIGNTDKLNENIEKSKRLYAENTSIQDEFARAIAKTTTPLDEMHTRVEDLQISIGKDLTKAIGAVAESDINPILEDFRVWLATSEEARVMFETTLPGAIKGVTAILQGVGTAAIATHNGIASVAQAIGNAWVAYEYGLESLRSWVMVGGKIDTAIAGMKASIAATIAGMVTDTQAKAAQIGTALTAPFDKAVGAVNRFGEAMNNAIFQNDKAVGFFQQLTDKIYGVEDALEGHSLTPAMYRYADAVMGVEEPQDQLNATLDVSKKKVTDLEAAYEANQDQLDQLRARVREYDNQIRLASDTEKAALREKKVLIQNQISDLITLGTTQKDQIQAAKKDLKDVSDAHKLVSQDVNLNTEAVNKWAVAYAGSRIAIGNVTEDTLLLQNTMNMAGISGKDALDKWAQAYANSAIALGNYNEEAERTTQLTEELSAATIGLGESFQTIGQAFKISGLGTIGAGLEKLPGIFTNIKKSMEAIPKSLSDVKGGIGSLFSGDMLGGLTSLIGGFGGITSAISAMAAAWDIGKKIFGSLKGLFAESKSEGQQAAEAIQAFVRKNIQGGDDMAVAMAQSLQDMKDAGFDYGKFLEQTGTTMDQVFGGISKNWQEGSTAMDLFTQAVASSGVEIGKAPQVALQMMAAMQDMGLSVEEVAEKMKEMAEKSGMNEDELKALADALNALPSDKEINIEIKTTGEIPKLARGGAVGRTGLAIVNEAGFEAARFLNGQMALLTTPGPALGAFPVGTEIIPHTRVPALLRDYPNLPRMATGGVVGATPMITVNPQIVITGNTFDKHFDINTLTTEISRKLERSIRESLRRVSV